jgi:serine/threonine protein kinase
MTVRLLGLERLEPSQERPVPVGLLVMEYVSGGTLANLAQNWRPGTGRGIPEGLLRRYVRSLVEALAHVHARGMAHRDLKGANVMLAPESQSIKLADFGSCKLPASVAEDLEGPSELSPGGQARPTTAISAHGVQRGGGKGGAQQLQG